MVLPAPSAMTAGENARLTCQVPRTNDFFIGVLLPLTSSRPHGFRSFPRGHRPGTQLFLDSRFRGNERSFAENFGRRHFAWPSRIARQIRSGVAGISMWRTPRWERASTSALATAGMAPTQPASPAPLTPSGLVLVGTGLLLTSTALMSVARGMA